MKKLIGDRQFYRRVLMIAVPIMIQNGITNFVNMLDNIMVGQIGTEQMSGVSIVNQLVFVYNITIFGAISGAGILGAQFYGNNDHKGLRNTFRFKVIFCTLLCGLGVFLLFHWGTPLINLYLRGEADSGNTALALKYAQDYLLFMLVGLLPFTLVQIYSSTLRETSETVKPMTAGMIAVVVNLIFNYLLIFGKFGFPALGVRGAAIATVMARFTECFYLLVWTHRHAGKNIFIQGAYRSLKIPLPLVAQIIKKGTPLLVNELLWSAGMAILLQCYSVRGLSVVAAMNISGTIFNVFNVVFIALGNSISIVVGQLLGAGKMEEARLTAYRMIAFSTMACLGVSVLMIVTRSLFPQIYNTAEEVRQLASSFIFIAGIFIPVNAFVHACYFTMRSGGKTVITFLFDSVFVWSVAIPTAYVLSRFTNMEIRSLYFLVCATDMIKCVIGFILVKKGVWLNRIVMDRPQD